MSRHSKKRHRGYTLGFGPPAPAEVVWPGFKVAFYETDEQGDPMSNAAPQEQPAERLAVQDFRGDKDSVVFRIAEAINGLIEETEFSEALDTELTEANEKIAALESENADLQRRNDNQYAYCKSLQQTLGEKDERVKGLVETCKTLRGRVVALEGELECSEGAHKLTAEAAHEAAIAQNGPTVLRFGDGTSRVYVLRTHHAIGRAKHALVIERGRYPGMVGSIYPERGGLGPGDYVLEFETGDSAFVFCREVTRLMNLLYTAENVGKDPA